MAAKRQNYISHNAVFCTLAHVIHGGNERAAEEPKATAESLAISIAINSDREMKGIQCQIPQNRVS